MNSVEKAFQQAILEDPDDDTPRLVYADWLDEHGDVDRADFIRTQVERARLPEYEPRWIELRRREAVLLDRNQAKWLEPLQVWARPGCVFQRGFVGELWCSASEFLKGGKSLLRRAPVTELILRQGEPLQLTALFDLPLLEPLHGLKITSGCMLSLDVLRALAASSHTASLRRLRLHLHDATVSVEVGQLLASSKHLSGLKHLELGGWATLGSSGPAALVAAPFFPHLTSLRLNNNMDGAGARTLLAALGTKGLETLGLTVLKIDAPAAVQLASSVRPGLQELDLRRNRELGDAGVEALVATPALSDLTVLRLADCGFGPAGARALAQSPYLRKLRHLVLCQNSIGVEGARALASSPYLENLTILNLVGSKLPQDAVEALGTSERLPRLAYLLVAADGRSAESWQDLKGRCRPQVLLDHEAFSFAASLGKSMSRTAMAENFPWVWSE